MGRANLNLNRTVSFYSKSNGTTQKGVGGSNKNVRIDFSSIKCINTHMKMSEHILVVTRIKISFKIDTVYYLPTENVRTDFTSDQN